MEKIMAFTPNLHKIKDVNMPKLQNYGSISKSNTKFDEVTFQGKTKEKAKKGIIATALIAVAAKLLLWAGEPAPDGKTKQADISPQNVQTLEESTSENNDTNWDSVDDLY